MIRWAACHCDRTIPATPPTSPPCSQLRGGRTTMFGHHPAPTPLVLAIAWGVTKMLGCHSLPPCACNRVGVYDDARLPPTLYTPCARNCVGGIPRHSATTHPPTPLALAIAWGVHHDVWPPLTTPSRSQLRGGCTTTLGHYPLTQPLALAIAWGGVERRSVATYHPLMLAIVWGVYCDTWPPPRPPLALAVAWGVYHDTRLLPTPSTPRARKHMGGVL
jgi:hypothetical protein